MVVVPALADTFGTPVGGVDYMTFVAVATIGLLVPLSTIQSGLGVVVDRLGGGLRDLLAAPISRPWIVAGNLVVAVALAGLQVAVLLGAAAVRGAEYDLSASGVLWFAAATLAFAVAMYGVAEVLANRLPSQEEYIAALPAVAIVPFFFAGSFFPISALPAGLTVVGKLLPITHVLALVRYGLAGDNGAGLHDIWGMSNHTAWRRSASASSPCSRWGSRRPQSAPSSAPPCAEPRPPPAERNASHARHPGRSVPPPHRVGRRAGHLGHRLPRPRRRRGAAHRPVPRPWRTAEEVTLSGLRGHGGGGFRTGRKWLSVLQSSRDDERRFVVANGAEGEPGTFKDRAILRHNPYQVIEGLAIAALTVRAARPSWPSSPASPSRSRSCDEPWRRDAGGRPRRRPPDQPRPRPRLVYLFGEEKALLEVIEGEDPLPRREPALSPRPVRVREPQMGWSAHRGGDAGGEASNPTIVNDVETLAAVAAHSGQRRRMAPGAGDLGLAGHHGVHRRGRCRSPRLRGARARHHDPRRHRPRRRWAPPRPDRIKAVFSGVSNGVITADQLDVPATYEGLAAIGSGLGSAGLIVYDDTAGHGRRGPLCSPAS